MIGGPGWSSNDVIEFFGDKFYGIPCSAVEKGGDPLGRIVHDYGYHSRGSYLINAAHSSTRITYTSFKETVKIMDGVIYLIKADLKSGFRQFGTHPVDWRFQIYCNGPNEHYIDIACPFGRTNSPLEFCPCVELFTKSITIRYDEEFLSRPSLGSYGDDIFGGFQHDTRYDTALQLRNYICSQGKRLTLKFNMDVLKTPLPASKLIEMCTSWDSNSGLYAWKSCPQPSLLPWSNSIVFV